MGAGSKSTTRRDISIRGATYDALRAHARRAGVSVDAVAERVVLRALRALAAAPGATVDRCGVP